jgi:hypothetical protein
MPSAWNLLGGTPKQENLMPAGNPSMQRVEASFPATDNMQFFQLGVMRAAPTL